MRDDTPPPCVSQASREEALEVSSATARRPEIESACLASGTPWVSQDAHEVGEGRPSANASRDDHGSKHAIHLVHSQTGKSCLRSAGLGCIRLNHPGRKVHVDGTYGPRHVTAQYAYTLRSMHLSILFAGRGRQHTARLTYILHCTSRPFPSG